MWPDIPRRGWNSRRAVWQRAIAAAFGVLWIALLGWALGGAPLP